MVASEATGLYPELRHVCIPYGDLWNGPNSRRIRVWTGLWCKRDTVLVPPKTIHAEADLVYLQVCGLYGYRYAKHYAAWTARVSR